MSSSAGVPTGNRVLVCLQKKNKDNVPVLAKFTQSVLDYFHDDRRHVGSLSVSLENCRLKLSDASQEKAIKIKRPAFCPVASLTPGDVDKLSPDTRDRGIGVGAAVVLESADNKVLLTRRAGTLRTFPNVWVPPGGHIEENETFVEAGLRELKEETGLVILPSECVTNNLKVLALWESVFPPKLSMGLPRRHHIVVYLHGKLTPNLTSDILNKRIKLCPVEAGACAWLDKELVKAITSASEEEGNFTPPKGIPDTIRGFAMDESGIQREADLPVEPLLRVSGISTEYERVSTGTKFALEEWLQLQ